VLFATMMRVPEKEKEKEKRAEEDRLSPIL
jgi:hypothetical protein